MEFCTAPNVSFIIQTTFSVWAISYDMRIGDLNVCIVSPPYKDLHPGAQKAFPSQSIQDTTDMAIPAKYREAKRGRDDVFLSAQISYREKLFCIE